MIRVLFICHGNICRSPMAELLLKNMVQQYGILNQFMISSAATSEEEMGNPVHPGTRKKLAEHGISSEGKYALKLRREDYERYDYLIGMDSRNIANILRITGGDREQKVAMLLEFAGESKEIADPWYTRDFERTYQEIRVGLTGLLQKLLGLSLDRLIEKGALYFKTLNEGVAHYQSCALSGTKESFYSFLKELKDQNGVLNSYTDFHYGALSIEEQKRVQDALSEQARSILFQMFPQSGIAYLALTDEVLALTVELNRKEILFCTYFFTASACTLWGNYNETYLLFWKREGDISQVLEKVNASGISLERELCWNNE